MSLFSEIVLMIVFGMGIFLIIAGVVAIFIAAIRFMILMDSAPEEIEGQRRKNNPHGIGD